MRIAMKKTLITLFLMLTCIFSGMAQTISVHDPVMIKENDTYYLFCTGRGIAVWSSPDMENWEREAPVLDRKSVV